MKTPEQLPPVPVGLSPAASLPDRFQRGKIKPSHFQKLAVVYVRQSSLQQVLENRESTARQYALADYAQTLGWPASRVLVIDEDQGQSGASAEQRRGFQRVLAEVTMDHVGIVFGLEMSRLARSSKDWHHLLEVCALFGTLLADQDGVYDASDPNDRLLLGLKGTMSEVELHTMRTRLDRGKLKKPSVGSYFTMSPWAISACSTVKWPLSPTSRPARWLVLLCQSRSLGAQYCSRRARATTSRIAAHRSHSLTRRWTSGNDRRRRSGRGGKSGPGSSHARPLGSCLPVQPD